MPGPRNIAQLQAELARLKEKLAEADRRTRELHGEIQHRICGLMSVIGAAARWSARRPTDFEEYASHLDGRLGALARAQLNALRAPFGSVELHDLIAEELLAHALVEGERLRISGPKLRLSGRAISLLWLVVHELAVNSVKYGALASARGRIAVVWRLQPSDAACIEMRWTEREGPPVQQDRRSGFGTEVIERRLAHELGGAGAISFAPAGLECRIAMPLSRQVRLAKAA